MSDEEKLLALFTLVHGEMTGSCSARVLHDDCGNPSEVACVKDGDVYWTSTREDLVFAYLTKDFT